MGKTGSNPVPGICEKSCKSQESGTCTCRDSTVTGHRHSAILTSLLMGAMVLIVWFLTEPDSAQASYRPAPSSVHRAALQQYPPPRGTTAKRAWVVCQVWLRRPYQCYAAVNVAWCESTLRPWAANGIYLGIFQMGRRERARFGHGRTTWDQARAARRYWLLSHWQPWQCRP